MIFTIGVLITIMTTYPFKTILPSNVILTPEEQIELRNFEQDYAVALEPMTNASNAAVKRSQVSLKYNLVGTNNAGIHYYCANEQTTLSVLAKNKEITPHIVSLMLETAEKFSSSSPITIRYLLLRNPIVYSDVEFFKQTFSKMLPSSCFMTLNDFIYYDEVVNVGVLMFLFNVASKNPAISNYTRQSYIEAIERREKDVFAWLKKENPVLVGLPLSWVLQVYSF
jgi:hypothetical protein